MLLRGGHRPGMTQEPITLLLQRARQGAPGAADELLPMVYDHLRRMAQVNMNHERTGHTLEATALVHEAYLKLVGPGEVDWADRNHFFGAAAQAMRRILVDHARARKAAKRGGGEADAKVERARAAAGSLAELAAQDDPEEILALDEALSRLEREEPDVASVVRLRFFAGLTGEQAALALGVSPRQVDRLWSYARAVLFRSVADRGA